LVDRLLAGRERFFDEPFLDSENVFVKCEKQHLKKEQVSHCGKFKQIILRLLGRAGCAAGIGMRNEWVSYLKDLDLREELRPSVDTDCPCLFGPLDVRFGRRNFPKGP
jgi:hypothetical protein